MSVELEKIEKEYRFKLSKLYAMGILKSSLTPVSFGGLTVDGPYVTVEDDLYVIKSYATYKAEIVLETKSLEEAVFRIFKSITQNIAFDYEFRHRIENQDCRIIAFQKHIEIMEGLDFSLNLINGLKLTYNEALGWKLFETV